MTRKTMVRPEYNAWQAMRARCLNPNHPAYKNYGGRGITVCDEWLGPGGKARFLADMGPRPSPEHSLDRINNDGPYCKDNCRWATQKQQCNNTRRNHRITIDGVTRTVTEWAEFRGLKLITLHFRLARRGWSERDAVMLPVGRTPRGEARRAREAERRRAAAKRRHRGKPKRVGGVCFMCGSRWRRVHHLQKVRGRNRPICIDCYRRAQKGTR